MDRRIPQFRADRPGDGLQLALPPGGVVSRATLWVNGEEREAAYGGRGEVRAAYQRVAVQQRRDPLLVTSKGADRVLAQAFPVPRGGGTIKFKIGMTAPLEIIEAWKARLTLPALIDRNFSFPADLRHNVWIESKQAMAASAPGLTATSAAPRLSRLTGSLGDGELARTRQTISIERNPKATSRLARLGDGEAGRAGGHPRQAARDDRDLDRHRWFAITAGKIDEIIAALDAIVPGSKVGAIIASDPMRQVPSAPWSDRTERRGYEALALHVFRRRAGQRGGARRGPDEAGGRA